MNRRAIVTGISGQDGHFMARLLADRGFEIVGLTSRPDAVARVETELAGLPVDVVAFDFAAPGAIAPLIARIRPSLIFNFAARATGQGMFDDPVAMTRINGVFPTEILEAIRQTDPAIGFCQASSAEMFGDVAETPQSERTSFRPKSPYGAAKLYAHNMVGIYRRAFGLRCCSAILYNHESIRRGPAFVTRKIAHAAAAIKLGQADRLVLGSIDQVRDWGYAPEYVEAMYRMALAEAPDDYVVATGRLTSVERVCEICFGHLGLDYSRYLELDPAFQRPINSTSLQGDPARIRADLGWSAETQVEAILTEMVDFDYAALSRDAAPSLSGVSHEF